MCIAIRKPNVARPYRRIPSQWRSATRYVESYVEKYVAKPERFPEGVETGRVWGTCKAEMLPVD